MASILQVHEKNPETKHIQTALNFLEKGKIILVPSETGYCFVGDCSQENVHTQFLTLRPGHPKNKPFSLCCKDISQVSQMTQMSTSVFRIAARLWPGPYTLIFKCSKNIHKFDKGPSRKTVGIRISSHNVLNRLIEEFQKPLLITSVTDEDELFEQNYFETDQDESSWWTNAYEINKKVPKNSLALVLENDKPVPMRVSSVIDFSDDAPVLIRDGGWDLDFIDFGNP